MAKLSYAFKKESIANLLEPDNDEFVGLIIGLTFSMPEMVKLYKVYFDYPNLDFRREEVMPVGPYTMADLDNPPADVTAALTADAESLLPEFYDRDFGFAFFNVIELKAVTVFSRKVVFTGSSIDFGELAIHDPLTKTYFTFKLEGDMAAVPSAPGGGSLTTSAQATGLPVISLSLPCPPYWDMLESVNNGLMAKVADPLFYSSFTRRLRSWVPPVLHPALRGIILAAIGGRENFDRIAAGRNLTLRDNSRAFAMATHEDIKRSVVVRVAGKESEK